MRTTFLFVLLFSVHRKMVIVKSASLILTIMHAIDNIMFIKIGVSRLNFLF